MLFEPVLPLQSKHFAQESFNPADKVQVATTVLAQAVLYFTNVARALLRSSA